MELNDLFVFMNTGVSVRLDKGEDVGSGSFLLRQAELSTLSTEARDHGVDLRQPAVRRQIYDLQRDLPAHQRNGVWGQNDASRF